MYNALIYKKVFTLITFVYTNKISLIAYLKLIKTDL
jgi:hypothetical protein